MLRKLYRVCRKTCVVIVSLSVSYMVFDIICTRIDHRRRGIWYEGNETHVPYPRRVA